MTDAATKIQNKAAAPGNHTWLSANAGSGKTRVLTNRVARLLLNGAEPQNILCLTYTKAAASEMQNRLFKTLGTWAMQDDVDLRKALAALGEPPDADLSRARTLFARAVETPGGLKIQTIHSLCASILRQFPLEAQVSPQFTELDETGQAALIDDVLNALAAAGEPALSRAAQHHPASLTELAQDVAKHADDFARPRSEEEIYKAFGVPPDRTGQNLVDMVFEPGDISFLRSLVPILRQYGSTNDGKLADRFSALPDRPSLYALEILEDCLLAKSGEKAFQAKALPTKPVREGPAFAPLLPQFAALQHRVETARPQRIALEAAELNAATHAFARAFLPAYAAAKAEQGVLDFDDLIRRTRELLTEDSLQWVLYRLDSRIDHLLVDEAQDTSPAQWRVIEALAEEMSSGLTDRPRTLFVVGDKKQSIYSFQGADAESFDRYMASFSRRLSGAGGLKTQAMQHSFRSSPAILTVVDAVFGGNQPSGVGTGVQHSAFHPDMPGRVDLWPLVERDEKSEELDWHVTDHRRAATPPAKKLAEMLAGKIGEMLSSGTIPGEKGLSRRIRPGDIMVLVQRRSELFDQIIAACKTRELPIAGADRLKIGSELAVRDLLALLNFLAMPDDDLSLAAALRSPLFGWSEQQLFDLAARREDKNLWHALRSRRDDFPDTHARLTALRKRVDYDRPFELLDRILTREGGRKALLARLGAEAGDGIDELLRQALAAERDTVPSLTRFLADARAADIEVKRESDNTGDLIRVMTVHGAKGLESPVVILPDTTFGKPRFRPELIKADIGFPVVRQAQDRSPAAVAAAGAAREAAAQAERDRLFYVAMTRAEKWLIVCGIQPPPNQARADNWHKMIAAGLERIETTTLEDPQIGQITRFAHGDWPEAAETAADEGAGQGDSLALPERVPAVPAPVALRAPSELGGEKVLGGGALEQPAARKRGRQVHLLLETLGDTPDPEDFARRLLSTGPDAAAEDELPGLLAEAQSTIRRHPGVFAGGALAEVGITADTAAGRISGTIDRLIVAPDRVLAVDFKTNAVVPAAPDETPEGLLRQMGAYLEALERIYPNRPVEVAILWTATSELMPLPHGIVRAALQRTPIS